MPYMNQPDDMHRIIGDMDKRLRKLETAVRFTAPNVDFSTNTPTNPRPGDIFFDTNSNKLVWWTGSNWRKITDTTFP